MSEELLVQFSDATKLNQQIPDQLTKEPDLQVSEIEGEVSNEKFSQLMDQNRHLAAIDRSEVAKLTPLEEASKLGGKLSVDQARNLTASLNEFRNRQKARLEQILNKVNTTSGVEMRPSVQKHLDARMNTINSQIDNISNQLNLPKDMPAAQSSEFADLKITTSEMAKPVEKFFNFVVRGERQLYSLENEIDAAFSSANEIPNAGVMLKLQLKMTHVSQQLELFTSMLNKGLESSKTVFNTQI